MVLKNVSYDDRDHDHLKYNERWFFEGSWNASNIPGKPTGTLTSANDLTANVTFTFPEPANAFYYYGIRRSNGGFYAICVDDDCNPPKPKFTNIDGLNRNDNGGNPPTILFSLNFDDLGIHTILLANQNDTRVVPSGKSQITIDRFEIQIDDGSIPPSSTSFTQGDPRPSTSSSPATRNSSSTVPVGAIVGSILGLMTLMMIVLRLFWMRRRAIAIRRQTQSHGVSNRKHVSPFLTSTPNQPLPWTGSGHHVTYTYTPRKKKQQPQPGLNVTMEEPIRSAQPALPNRKQIPVIRANARSGNEQTPRRATVDAGSGFGFGFRSDYSTVPPSYHTLADLPKS